MSSEVTTMTKPAAMPARIKDYVEGLREEMRRVTWPSWQQVRATTLVVIVAVFVFSAYFAVVDSIVALGIDRLFKGVPK